MTDSQLQVFMNQLTSGGSDKKSSNNNTNANANANNTADNTEKAADKSNTANQETK